MGLMQYFPLDLPQIHHPPQEEHSPPPDSVCPCGHCEADGRVANERQEEQLAYLGVAQATFVQVQSLVS